MCVCIHCLISFLSLFLFISFLCLFFLDSIDFPFFLFFFYIRPCIYIFHVSSFFPLVERKLLHITFAINIMMTIITIIITMIMMMMIIIIFITISLWIFFYYNYYHYFLAQLLLLFLIIIIFIIVITIIIIIIIIYILKGYTLFTTISGVYKTIISNIVLKKTTHFNVCLSFKHSSYKYLCISIYR